MTSPVTGALVTQRSRDPEVARALLSERFKSHRIRRLDGSEFDFVNMSAPVPGGSFNILRYGAAVEITPDPFDDFFMLEIPLNAGVDLHCQGGSTVRSDRDKALFLGPDLRFASTWRAGCMQLMLKIRTRDVLARWQLMTGDATAPLPSVHPEIDLRSPEGWRVRQMMDLMRVEFERSVATQVNHLAQTPLAGAAIDAVLSCLRLRSENDPSVRERRVIPGELRLLLRYIEENLSGDLSIKRLVAVTNSSERTIFNHFGHFLEQTPRDYIQERRLRLSRRLLKSGNHTVSEAARMSGFGHQGRFAAIYRSRYGEKPSQT